MAGQSLSQMVDGQKRTYLPTRPLTLTNFYVWSQIKIPVYAVAPVPNVEELGLRITNAAEQRNVVMKSDMRKRRFIEP